MSDAPQSTVDAVSQQRDAFIDRFTQNMSGVLNIFSIYLGDRLGFYRALVDGGPCTSLELAARTSSQERYVREWLEQQTMAEILEVDDENLPAARRVYYLPPGRAEVLTDTESASYLTPITRMLVSLVKPLPAVLEAYHNGGGVPYEAYGMDLSEGLAEATSWAFRYELAQKWLPSIPELHHRLQANPPARVADIGCGFGWSSLGMALGYPKIQVDGFDLDPFSIERAQAIAAENRLSDRVSFQARDAGDPDLAGQYDLVTAFQCIHDMPDPVSVLRSMRRMAARDGTVLVADGKAGEKFTARGTIDEVIDYGWSVLHCLPVGMQGPNPAGTGNGMRPPVLRGYAMEAGYREVEILPIENNYYQFYSLNA